MNVRHILGIYGGKDSSELEHFPKTPFFVGSIILLYAPFFNIKINNQIEI